MNRILNGVMLVTILLLATVCQFLPWTARRR